MSAKPAACFAPKAQPPAHPPSVAWALRARVRAPADLV